MRVQVQSPEPTEKGLGEVVCAFNSRAGEVETGGFLGLAYQPDSDSRFSERLCHKKIRSKETEVGT